MSGRGRFANNQELSVARAESVAGVIRPRSPIPAGSR